MVNGITVTDIQVFPVKEQQPDSNLMGFAKVVLNDALVITGLRVINGAKGYFVGFPSKWNADEQKGYDIVFPITAELRTYITNEVLEACAKKMDAIKSVQ